MSYLIDPPLLVACGAVIEESLGESPAAARAAGAGTVATFIGVSAALYANAPGLDPLYRPFGARNGREFMLTSGLGRTKGPKTRLGHGAALLPFVLYPLWLALGRAAWRARRSGGASPPGETS